MKKLLLLIIAISLTLSLSAKDKKADNIPSKVKDALTKVFPNAKNVNWSKEKNEFEAEFTNAGLKTSVNFDKDGKVLETEAAIEKSSLPKGVEEYIAKNCKGFKITETAKIVDAKGNTTYETEISKGKVKKDLEFDKDGKLIKR